jgi:hypothetical protein
MKVLVPNGMGKFSSAQNSLPADTEHPKHPNEGKPSGNPAEKRSCPRYPFSQPVEAIDIQVNTRIVGRISDIARYGCYVETISPFAAKASALLTITRCQQSFKTPAKVVYSQIGMGMGLLFTATDATEVDVLEKWLSELAGGQPRLADASSFERPSDLATDADYALRKVVREVIICLCRKEIMNDIEAKAMLEKLSINGSGG